MNVLVPPQLLNVVIVHAPVFEQQLPRKAEVAQNAPFEHVRVGLTFTPAPAKTLVPVQLTPVVIEHPPFGAQQVPSARLHGLSETHVVPSPR